MVAGSWQIKYELLLKCQPYLAKKNRDDNSLKSLLMYRYFFFVAGASFEHNIKKQTNIEFSQCQ
jgi:hypothetical protein